MKRTELLREFAPIPPIGMLLDLKFDKTAADRN